MSNTMRAPFLQPKRILCLFAHPDDETFGPGGSLAVWKEQGAEVHIICATKGEGGGSSTARVKELKTAAKILNLNSVTFLKFKDGKIGNNQLIELENAFIPFINTLQPDTIVTFDLNANFFGSVFVSSLVFVGAPIEKKTSPYLASCSANSGK